MINANESVKRLAAERLFKSSKTYYDFQLRNNNIFPKTYLPYAEIKEKIKSKFSLIQSIGKESQDLSPVSEVANAQEDSSGNSSSFLATINNNQAISSHDAKDSDTSASVIRVLTEKPTLKNTGRKLLCAGGMRGFIYLDATDENFIYKHLTGEDQYASAVREAECFNAFYGDKSAQAIHVAEERYVRMPIVPGKPLSLIQLSEMPELFPDRNELRKMYWTMADKLLEAGIVHNDLKDSNILFDKERRCFNPVDIFNKLDIRVMTQEEQRAHYADYLAKIEEEIDRAVSRRL